MKYSIIVPVFNRPDEVDELLESLTHQTEKDFEVVIVEDGSQTPCEDVCKRYENLMDIHYYYKENSGPGQSRNYGAERAKGEYLLILDSDVVLPEGYLKAVSDELSREPADAFGGPDKAHSSFTDTQKAISYSMTSFFTTGGIRGGKKKMAVAVCSLKHGYGISAAPTSANSGDRFTTAVSPASTFTRSIQRVSSSYISCRWSSPWA